ncbi:MAG: transporter small permease subunit [Sedimentibacter sp.]|nr:transporter small permease subunit [Sedimentibacter sp.]
MNNIKKILSFIRNCVEIYIPVASFSIMFVTFIAQVFFRYVLRQPISWAYEVTVVCYLWTVILGACLAQRKNSHVTFTLVYDRLSVKGKALCSFFGNLIIAVAFAVSLVPSIKYIDFIKIQETSVLHVGMNIIYAPYILFLFFILAYILVDLYEDFMVFTGLSGNNAADKIEIIESTLGKENENGI